MFFETFFSIKLLHAVTTFTLSNQDPRFLPILILVAAKHTTLEDFLPSKIDEFVLFFRKRQPSKNMEERSVKIKLSFLAPLCGHTHTFLRIPLSKNLENSHGSALLWFRSPLLKPEKIPPPSLAPSISPFPRDSGKKIKRKKEERENKPLLLYQAAPLKSPSTRTRIRSWRTIGFSCLLLSLSSALASFLLAARKF